MKDTPYIADTMDTPDIPDFTDIPDTPAMRDKTYDHVRSSALNVIFAAGWLLGDDMGRDAII